MTEDHDATNGSTARERELEIEVARLTAELETLRGDDPADATSRFLAMAAQTVDLVVSDAHREADEIVEEVSAQAEARRDEATRVAAEAEALAEMYLADADKAQEVIDEANTEALSIRETAEADAEKLLITGHEKITAEVASLDEARAALQTERSALESYHEELRGRVQELAETMVSFMGTDPALDGPAIEHQVGPELGSVSSGSPSDTVPEDHAVAVAGDRDDKADADTWSEMLESAIPAEEQIVDVPDTSIDEIPEGPVMSFGGVPVVEETDGDIDADKASSAGLFARSDSDNGDDELVAEDSDTGFDDLTEADDGDSGDDESSLFGTFGARLVEQTSTADLTDALDTESDAADDAFLEFIDGDTEPDPSRDWLLRPEQS